MNKALDILNVWKCIAEATLSGNYTSTPCYDVPPDIQEHLLAVAKFIAGLLGWA